MRNKYIDPVVLCEEVMGLHYPPTSTGLRDRYRELVKMYHPDANKDGGDAKKFIAVKDAYDVLRDLTLDNLEDKLTSDYTADGFKKSDLGEGYQPPMPNCPECEGLGYSEQEREIVTHLKLCDFCYGQRLAFRCNACKGTGKFTQRNTRRIVDCLRCGGVGYLVPKVRMSIFDKSVHDCPKCKGKGTIFETRKNLDMYKCSTCEGRGQIYIANPVLRINSL